MATVPSLDAEAAVRRFMQVVDEQMHQIDESSQLPDLSVRFTVEGLGSWLLRVTSGLGSCELEATCAPGGGGTAPGALPLPGFGDVAACTEAEVDCACKTTLGALERIATGKLKPALAAVSGQLSVVGDRKVFASLRQPLADAVRAFADERRALAEAARDERVGALHVVVPSVTVIREGLERYAAYEVRVSEAGDAWVVRARWSDVRRLADSLRAHAARERRWRVQATALRGVGGSSALALSGLAGGGNGVGSGGCGAPSQHGASEAPALPEDSALAIAAGVRAPALARWADLRRSLAPPFLERRRRRVALFLQDALRAYPKTSVMHGQGPPPLVRFLAPAGGGSAAGGAACSTAGPAAAAAASEGALGRARLPGSSCAAATLGTGVGVGIGALGAGGDCGSPLAEVRAEIARAQAMPIDWDRQGYDARRLLFARLRAMERALAKTLAGGGGRLRVVDGCGGSDVDGGVESGGATAVAIAAPARSRDVVGAVVAAVHVVAAMALAYWAVQRAVTAATPQATIVWLGVAAAVCRVTALGAVAALTSAAATAAGAGKAAAAAAATSLAAATAAPGADDVAASVAVGMAVDFNIHVSGRAPDSDDAQCPTGDPASSTASWTSTEAPVATAAWAAASQAVGACAWRLAEVSCEAPATAVVVLSALVALHRLWPAALRLWRIYATAVATIGTYELLRRALKWARASADTERRLYALADELVAPFVCAQLGALRSLWVKFGQYIGSRTDIVPRAWGVALEALQDDLPADRTAHVRATVLAELGTPLEELFEHFDMRPMASASVAQVHRATLKRGRHRVAVKLQHEGIEDLMRADFVAALRIAGWVTRRDERYQPMLTVLQAWAREVERELNFENEAKNLRAVRANLARAGVDVAVPAPVEGLVGRRAFAMTFVDGFKLTDCEQLRLHGVDKEALMRRVTLAYACQLFYDGEFNADPHPGNLLVQVDSDTGTVRPALLDFGWTVCLPDERRLAYCALVHATSELDAHGIAAAMRDLGLASNQPDRPERDLAFWAYYLRDTGSRETQRREMDEFLAQRKEERADDKARGEKGRRMIHVPDDFMFVLRTIGLLRGLATTLSVRVPYLELLCLYARRALLEQEMAPGAGSAAHARAQRLREGSGGPA